VNEKPKTARRAPKKENKMRLKKLIILVAVCVAAICAVGCSSDSEVASYNVTQDAHQFKVFRRVVFYNGITNEYILEIRAFCSVTPEPDGRVSVIIKKENGTFLKHYLGLSDNVTYFCEQLDPSSVSSTHYRVLFKPLAIVPDVKVIQ
jgi:hypothetical protein